MPVFSAHLGYMFTELPLERRFAAAAEAGFAHVEHPAPFALPAARCRLRLWPPPTCFQPPLRLSAMVSIRFAAASSVRVIEFWLS